VKQILGMLQSRVFTCMERLDVGATVIGKYESFTQWKPGGKNLLCTWASPRGPAVPYAISSLDGGS
jgi:hypothetical protein